MANLSDVLATSGAVNPLVNPMTTSGDIIYGGTSGAPTRLAKGSDGQVLTLASGVPSWAAASGGGAIDYASGMVSITSASDTPSVGRLNLVSGTSADYTVGNFPAASSNGNKCIEFLISTAGTKLYTINGKVYWAGERVTLISDGSNWLVLDELLKPTKAGIYQSANQLFNADIGTLVNMDAQKTAPSVASMQDLTNKKIIIPRAGTYQVIYKYATRSTNSSVTRLEPRIYKNGVQIDYNNQYCEASSSYALTSVFVVEDLVAGDYLQAYFRYTAGSYTTSVLYAGINDTFMIVREAI